jgi:lipopolysaccharide export system protein LptA
MTPRFQFPLAQASRRRAYQSVLVLACALALPALPAAAQSNSQSNNEQAAATTPTANGSNGGGGFDFSSSSKPIDITADNGIEWRKAEKSYVAHGNALAVQGNQSIAGDVLSAFYSNDSNHIDRMTAEGHVIVKNGSQTAYGDHADYSDAKKLLVLTGKSLKAVNNDNGDTSTARDSMEYWKDRDAIVARGNVYSVHGDTKVHSDMQTGYFHPDSTGKKVMYQIEAVGNVHTVTTKQDSTADKMVYNLETKVAVLTGNVRIVQGNDVFTGDRAEIDTVKNVSRLLADKSKGNRRVRTVIGPKGGGNASGGANTTTTNP